MRPLVLATLPLLAGCGFIAGYAPGRTPAHSHAASIRVGGAARDYILHVPPSLTPGARVPLVLVLHGYGGSAGQLERRTGLDAAADSAGFLVAYLQGQGGFFEKRHWDAFSPASPDVAFVRSLLDSLPRAQPVDTARVYAAGFSNGAFMAHRLGASLGARLAGIASVAGSIGRRLADGRERTIPPPTVPLSVVLVHGLEDRTVAYGDTSGAGLGAIPAPRSAAFWAAADRCTQGPARDTLAGGALWRDRWSGCADGTAVALYTVVHGGHAWPHAGPVDATALVTAFLAAHVRR